MTIEHVVVVVRILEVNGILLPGHKGSTVESVLSKAASLDVVVVRPVSGYVTLGDACCLFVAAVVCR